MTDDLSVSAERHVNGSEPAALTRTHIPVGETIGQGHKRTLWRITPRDQDATTVSQTLVHREFEGLAIDVIVAERPWEQKDELALYIEGKPFTAQAAIVKLLFCLLEHPGCVYSFAPLSSALGLSGRDARRKKNTLIEHARRCRLLLTGANLPLSIAVVPEVGYALCRKA